MKQKPYQPKGRVRVTLTFDMLFLEEVHGISPEIEQTSWFAPIGQSHELKRLGACAVTNVKRNVRVIEKRNPRTTHPEKP